MRWVDVPGGGVILRQGREWLARPDGVGMNALLRFRTEREARAYAEGPRGQWSGWGSFAHIPGAIGTGY